MRCFIGLEPDAKSKMAIDNWRQHALPAIEGKVPAANFHITLAFLGQLNHSQLEQLQTTLEQATALPACSIQLNTLGYFAKPKVLFVGTDEIQPELMQLATSVTSLTQQAGLQLRHQTYVPHVTLYRKCPSNPPAALFSPDIELQFTQFHLYESVSSSGGVRYPIINSWSLY
ncbi:RNA 2',3'-cyclic phosphodiesterase [Neptunicella marina]|uniref:RNA 2',3'-cyclic phosphodiesterase n=1 Tax=Neptunicella marina TaxID=2125989 RepID=A0A8J6IRX1_9ALTE|nr:RNA 2',3'-cyclic phosphodiesterase [Neptunicella marina]MBC3765149.1 RNA 2',3'-cyclic phosphodiesterase [Neptunicella marina]